MLNTQRQTIYAQRLQVLEGKDVKDNIVKMIDETIAPCGACCHRRTQPDFDRNG